jgi:hypothetical protein
MKHPLAILAVIIIVMGWSLSASAGPGSSDRENWSTSQGQGLEVPGAGLDRGDEEQEELDGHGDPHDLGGGFRGVGSPAGACPTVPVWITPVAQMIMQLI